MGKFTAIPTPRKKAIKWYLEHHEWMDNITSGAYAKYYTDMYGNK